MFIWQLWRGIYDAVTEDLIKSIKESYHWISQYGIANSKSCISAEEILLPLISKDLRFVRYSKGVISDIRLLLKTRYLIAVRFSIG